MRPSGSTPVPLARGPAGIKPAGEVIGVATDTAFCGSALARAGGCASAATLAAVAARHSVSRVLREITEAKDDAGTRGIARDRQPLTASSQPGKA
jgi:hypothetical protein